MLVCVELVCYEEETAWESSCIFFATFVRFSLWLRVTIGIHAVFPSWSKTQTFQSHILSLQEVDTQSYITISVILLHVFQVFPFVFCHPAAFVLMWDCFPSFSVYLIISAPLMLSTVSSYRLLMVTIFNRAAHALCSPVVVLQMGACSCLIAHLQKVPV